ncbi:type II toxin-antitoxin system RelE/ParE family toxin [Volucribacter amazonae]|uniref:Uncharacterized protein n=1 Tax=Volucribacter amazonae TaxID=256731 RepID=A0A9X4PCV9_9PAST|nr:type II toxin-antitoxin system RelE/ParE family toxin [Volucribacter amazonae]MDG6895314.1 hypothetical protein [Volucribacter amazonae]
MDFDYKIKWIESAEEELLKKAEFIFEQSKNKDIALKFINDIKENALKRLTLIAHSFNDKEIKFYTLLNGHRVKFFVEHNQKTIYIIDFIAKGRNCH